MKNFIQEGCSLDIVVPSGGCASGDIVVIGSLIGVASMTALAGDTIAMSMEGVFKLTKATGTAWSAGDKIYWDGTNKNANKTSSGNTLIGVATAAALSADTTGLVLLGPTTV